jgi:hypothetical protein
MNSQTTRGSAFDCEELRSLACPCELSVKYDVLSNVATQFLRSPQGHTHPKDVVVNREIMKLDKSLNILSILCELTRANPVSRPSDLIELAFDELPRRAWFTDQYFNILATIQPKAVSALMRSCRGDPKYLTISHIHQQYKSDSEAYQGMVARNDERSRRREIGLRTTEDEPVNHFVHIVAFSSDPFFVMISSDSMLDRCSDFIGLDCTYKVTTSGCPVLVIGTEDFFHSCRLIALVILSNEDTVSIEAVLRKLKQLVETRRSNSWEPKFIMADGAKAITTACYAVFGTGILRLNCFFHTMQAIRTRVLRGDFNLNKRDWDLHIKNSLQKMSLCYTREDFAEKINLFKRRWQSHTEFIKYLDDGYFNLNSWTSNWYLIPGNNLEAFGVARTNNFIESFNRKLKALLVKGRIMPLRGVVLAFKNAHMSLESRITAIPDRVTYYEERNIPLWRKALEIKEMISLGNLKVEHLGEGHFLPQAFHLSGEVCAFVPLQSTEQLISESVTCFLPEKSRSPAQSIQLKPHEGGPFCVCHYFLKKGFCFHICFLFLEYRQLGLPEVHIPIGKPITLYGVCCPRKNQTNCLSRSVRRTKRSRK